MANNNKAVTITVLTSLRFFAAIMVVFFHFGTLITLPPIINNLVGTGYLGVNFFFVLSGFILTYNYLNYFGKPNSYIHFLRARFARIFPMHFLSLLLITPLTLIMVSAQVGVFSQHTISNSTLLISWFTNLVLVQNYIPKWDFQQTWNAPSWSLGTEFFFYFLFPFFLIFTSKNFKTIKSLFILFFTIILIQVMIYSSLTIIDLNSSSNDFEEMINWISSRSPLLSVWQFFLGCLSGQIFLKTPHSFKFTILMKIREDEKFRNILLLIFIGLFFFLIFLPLPLYTTKVGTILRGGRDSLAYSPVFLCLIYILSSGPTFAHKFLLQPIIVLLGEASYSIYILHYVFFRVVSFADSKDVLFNNIISLSAIFVTVILSIICFKFYEIPLREKLRGRLKVSSQQSKVENQLNPRSP